MAACRYEDVLQMIRAGARDDEIVKKYPEFGQENCVGTIADTIAVYRKIVAGTISYGKGADRCPYGWSKALGLRYDHREEADSRTVKRVMTMTRRRTNAIRGLLKRTDFF